MMEERQRGQARGEHAGPLILLVLLVAAFVPSVMLSFDLQGLVKDLAVAALAAAEPRNCDLRQFSVAPSQGQEDRSALELPAVFQVSEDSVPLSDRGSRLERLFLEAPSQPVPGSHEWPPGPASSPRSPPSLLPACA